jgi:hypothetical protein
MSCCIRLRIGVAPPPSSVRRNVGGNVRTRCCKERRDETQVSVWAPRTSRQQSLIGVGKGSLAKGEAPLLHRERWRANGVSAVHWVQHVFARGRGLFSLVAAGDADGRLPAAVKQTQLHGDTIQEVTYPTALKRDEWSQTKRSTSIGMHIRSALSLSLCSPHIHFTPRSSATNSPIASRLLAISAFQCRTTESHTSQRVK